MAQVQVGTVLTSTGPESISFGEDGDDMFHLRDAVLLVFEHTEQHGTGALVVNRATPVRVGELKISRFQHFRSNFMFQGGPLGSTSDIVLGQQGPWYWIHNERDVKGAAHLAGDIYMGGKVDEVDSLRKNPERVKFFWRHCYFKPGQIDALVSRSNMVQLPCTSDVVLFDKVEGKRLPRMPKLSIGDS